MMLRRAAALLTAAFMFHLNVAASDNACATHQGALQHSSQVRAMTGMDMAPATSAGVAPHAEPTHQCDTPVVPGCCQAMVSCGSAYVGSTTVPTASWSGSTEFGRAKFNVLQSRSAAPEPPPPRA